MLAICAHEATVLSLPKAKHVLRTRYNPAILCSSCWPEIVSSRIFNKSITIQKIYA